MATTRGSAQAGSLLRGVFLFLLIALMVLLVFLTLRSLFSLPSSTAGSGATTEPVDDSDDGTTTDPADVQPAETAPAGPAVVVPLDGDADSEGGVACGRPVGAAEGDPFRIQVDDRSDSAEDLVIGVALLDGDNQRSSRQISLSAAETDGVRQITVPDSGGGIYRSCVVTAIQRGDRVIITGR